MTGSDETRRGAPTMGDTFEGKEAGAVPEGAEVAPGVVLDPETRQPMAMPGGATPPPTAPPETLGGPVDNAPQMEQPDDLQGPPS